MSADLDKRIRDRAYEIWQAEGEPHGRDQEHWDKAAAEYAEAQDQTPAVASTGAAATKAPTRKRATKADPAPARAKRTTTRKSSTK